MNKKQLRSYANRLRLKNERNAKKNYKRVLQPFINFSNRLMKEFKKSIEDGIKVDDKFNEEMLSALTITGKINSSDFVDFFINNLDIKYDDNFISVVKSKVFDKYAKNNMAKKVSKISETLQNQLNNEISRMSIAGYSSNDIVEKIIELSSGKISLERSLFIVREETSQVFAISNNITAKESGLKYKTWIHAGGGKTDRANHVSLDRITIKIDEYFNVGNYKGLYPKDQNLPFSEVANCYCVIFYERKNT